MSHSKSECQKSFEHADYTRETTFHLAKYKREGGSGRVKPVAVHEMRIFFYGEIIMGIIHIILS